MGQLQLHGPGKQAVASGVRRAACRRNKRQQSRRQAAATLQARAEPVSAGTQAMAEAGVSTMQSSAQAGAPQASQAPVLRGHEVEERAMQACIQHHQQHPHGLQLPNRWGASGLDDAFSRCGIVTEGYAKTFYLGTQLMTPEKARAVWAVYVWCRRTDELVDGPNASRITPAALDRWEERLEGIFEGRPYDILDAALTHTVSQFPVHIQPFRDMIDGMRMDLVKDRYETFDELYEYCYRVAGTVGLMTTPIMGIDPAYKGDLEPVYKAALGLGTANQLTNILRDVGEDVNERNRVYIPLDELREFGIPEQAMTAVCPSSRTPLHCGKQSYCHGLMQSRAWFMGCTELSSQSLQEAEAGVDFLDKDARWPVWSALILYRQILDGIEKNGYNNFSKRAYVPKWKKLASLPFAAVRAQMASNLKAANQPQAAASH
eukprot:jgi/Astpho2/8478/Aster-05523